MNLQGGFYREVCSVAPEQAREIWDITLRRIVIVTGGIGDQVESILNSIVGRDLGQKLIQTAPPVKLIRNLQEGRLDHLLKSVYSSAPHSPEIRADQPLNPAVRADLEDLINKVSQVKSGMVEDWVAIERLNACQKLLLEIRGRY